MKKLSEYQTMAFDCDGVILNSNHIKTQAFYSLALPYGTLVAADLVDYHVANGGIARDKKIDHLFHSILKRAPSKGERTNLMDTYADLIFERLMKAEIANGLKDLKLRTKGAEWIVVSGGNQGELRTIFERRALDSHFPIANVFGSPRSKHQIIEDGHKQGQFKAPVLFVGDSHYDHQVAQDFNFDFVFTSAWSEWKNPKLGENSIMIDYIADLLEI
jgi:HAD superfamily hydrolase (TIGR01549 family)